MYDIMIKIQVDKMGAKTMYNSQLTTFISVAESGRSIVYYTDCCYEANKYFGRTDWYNFVCTN